MIHSVLGQNERWAQLTALQLSAAAQSGQGGGPAFSNAGTTTADPTVVDPIAGSMPSPLSSNMSFMLMMLGGGLDSATGSGAAGGTGLTSGSASTTGSPNTTPGTQGGTGAAPILANLQIASLTGSTSGDAALSSATAPAGSGASPTSSSLLQGLNSIVTDLGTTAATTGRTQPPPPPPSAAPTGPPSRGNDITNPSWAAAVATWGDGPSGPGGGWQEQFALAAYASGNVSGLSGVSDSARESLTV